MPHSYMPEAAPDLRQTRLVRVRQVLGRHDFVCGLTAAWLYGVDARDPRSDLVWIGCPSGRRTRDREGCLTREIAVEVGDLDLVDGVLLTTPVRTLYDCARWLAPVEGLVVADSLVHGGLVTAEDISRYRNSHKATPGVTRLDALLAMLEPLSGSAMQTRMRHLLVTSGLPRPSAQHVVKDSAGRFLGRLDLAYVGARLAIECDAAPQWDERLAADRRRDALRALGWRVIVVNESDLDVPAQVVGEVRAALQLAA